MPPHTHNLLAFIIFRNTFHKRWCLRWIINLDWHKRKKEPRADCCVSGKPCRFSSKSQKIFSILSEEMNGTESRGKQFEQFSFALVSKVNLSAKTFLRSVAKWIGWKKFQIKTLETSSELLHVKQIFMFIFRRKFMKQWVRNTHYLILMILIENISSSSGCYVAHKKGWIEWIKFVPFIICSRNTRCEIVKLLIFNLVINLSMFSVFVYSLEVNILINWEVLYFKIIEGNEPLKIIGCK